MSYYKVTDSELTSVANKIRQKSGSESSLEWPDGYLLGIDSIESGEGYPEPTGTINITQNGTTNVKNYASATVAVPNSYAAGDEGKVVSNSALISQTSATKTANGTYDTTTNNSVIVAIPRANGEVF